MPSFPSVGHLCAVSCEEYEAVSTTTRHRDAVNFKLIHMCRRSLYVHPLFGIAALHANIEFKLEAILSVQVFSQLKSDYCTMS